MSILQPNKLTQVLLFLGVFLLGTLFLPGKVQAQENSMPNITYASGKVVTIEEEHSVDLGGNPFFTQKVLVHLNNPDKEVEVQLGNEYQPVNAQQKVAPGQKVVLAIQVQPDGSTTYAITDTYRLPVLFWFAIGFFVLVIIVARAQGIASIIGMLLSVGVLVGYVVPQIMAGQNPLVVTMIGSAIIGAASIYLSHGWNRHSHIALASIFLTLIAVAALAYGGVHSAHLTGISSDESAFLQFGPTARINLQGLLLSGIMFGALGVLDDITTAQVAVVFELFGAKPDMSFKELFARANKIGKTHVASLVNTLILAYVGTNLPLFLLFLTTSFLPGWVALNSEIIAEEVIRTLAGSMGLVLAVPLTTALATFIAIHGKQFFEESPESSHRHRHHH